MTPQTRPSTTGDVMYGRKKMPRNASRPRNLRAFSATAITSARLICTTPITTISQRELKRAVWTRLSCSRLTKLPAPMNTLW